jgi:hypothetical protein
MADLEVRMSKLVLRLVCLLGAFPSIADAAEYPVVGMSQSVSPDPDLKAFVASFHAAITAKKPDYKKINAMFAPRVAAFTRSLDPLQPWGKRDAITKDHLNEVVDVIVEQGPPQDGVAAPDYRPDALAMMANMIGDASHLGKIKEVPGSLCAPAAWSYDVKSMQKFAASNDDQISSLRFFAVTKTMLAKPKASAKSTGELPAYVPLSFIYEKNTPSNWGKFVSANGLTGFLRDDVAQLGFSQMHVCFGKVSGKYRVTGIFGYGL